MTFDWLQNKYTEYSGFNRTIGVFLYSTIQTKPHMLSVSDFTLQQSSIMF